jgi:hypothetical protein
VQSHANSSNSSEARRSTAAQNLQELWHALTKEKDEQNKWEGGIPAERNRRVTCLWQLGDDAMGRREQKEMEMEAEAAFTKKKW